MSRKKSRRFAELATFPNVFDRDAAGPGGGWIREYFGNDKPLVLELGCGKGEYSLELARRFPAKNVLGVDRKGERIWKGARQAVELGMGNVAFLRTRIEDLGELLEDAQVEQIWMPFPDPLPKRKQAKHRLLAERFWSMYRRVLIPGGLIHIKTDDQGFLNYALERVAEEGAALKGLVPDLSEVDSEMSLVQIRTTFEQRHLAAGKTIKYLAFSLA